MANSTAGGLFTFAQKANYWNELYDHPASLFEHHMLLRRNYASEYICRHFLTRSQLLDLGCGAGVLSEKLIERGFKVTAADDSLDMLDLAGERLKHFPEDTYRLLHANCLQLPFDDASFDLVVCLGVFGYFDQVTQALREIHRVLRPGGTLILSVRNAHTQYVFDFFQLLKLPFRLLRRGIRRLAGTSPAAAEAMMHGTPTDDGFRIRIYQSPAPLIEGVTRRGFALTRFDGFGYGPVAFAERKLLPVSLSIRLSDFLNRSMSATGLDKIGRWVADVSFYIFKRID